MIKSRMIRWVGHVAHMGQKTNEYKALVGKSEGKREVGRSIHRWEDNIKVDI
jgi:hypothetical protein